MPSTWPIWIGFLALIVLLLAIDLGIFHRQAHRVSVKESLIWSAIWIAVAFFFSLFIYFGYEHGWMGLGRTPTALHPEGLDGTTATVLYLTGYLIEKSLSVDNLFVISVIFSYFAIPPIYQHRVLFWGIVGAILLRGLMIGAGTALIDRFHWILYLFGIFLVLTGLRMLWRRKSPAASPDTLVVRLVRRFVPLTSQFYGQRFWITRPRLAPDDLAQQHSQARLLGTPLILALVAVESGDILFAVDSVPAVFAITTDPLLVMTSNTFAILGLRALYFALAGILNRFYYLQHALALILTLIGLKMLFSAQLAHWLGRGRGVIFYMLATVALILLAGILLSLRHPGTTSEQHPTPA